MFELFKIMPEDIMHGYERMVEAAKTIPKNGLVLYDAFFNTETERLNGYIQKLEAIPVPQKWEPQHSRIIDMLLGTQKNYRLIRESDDTQDPIQGVIAISALADTIFRDLIFVVGDYKSIFPPH
jgi:hypothetical protein